MTEAQAQQMIELLKQILELLKQADIHHKYPRSN